MMKTLKVHTCNYAGFMPRNRQFGYIFTSYSNNPYIDAAHELGHGMFLLDNWNEARILTEVEYAIKNNHGIVPNHQDPNFIMKTLFQDRISHLL